MTKHKVFISYHHANDEDYKIEFEEKFEHLFINKSVQDGEYDEDLSDDYIKRLIQEEKITDCTVVVVLIGTETYKRKHVDWEISAGISGKVGGRTGLIGILLPSYYDSDENKSLEGAGYKSSTIPPRLYDNVETEYAKIYKWSNAIKKNTDGEYRIKRWIDEAFDRKNDDSIKTDNSREQFKRNL